MKIFDNIMSWKKPEMLDLAKELNIKGRSKMNKGEVAESISEILLSDEYFKTVLAALDKEQTECLVIGARTTKLKSWMFSKSDFYWNWVIYHLKTNNTVCVTK